MKTLAAVPWVLGAMSACAGVGLLLASGLDGSAIDACGSTLWARRVGSKRVVRVLFAVRDLFAVREWHAASWALVVTSFAALVVGFVRRALARRRPSTPARF
jgi:hypothetical protein